MSYPSPSSINQLINKNPENSKTKPRLEVGAYNQYNTISKKFSSNIDDLRNINNMFGLDSGIRYDIITKLPEYNTQLSFSNLIQFYGFWSLDNSVSLSKNYISTLNTSNIENIELMENYNYVITYILFLFFSNQIINLSDTVENSFQPDINNQQNSPNFTKVIINLKNFINQSGQLSSSLGAGNYNIGTDEQNKGFVYHMCVNDIYNFFTEKNKFLIEPGQNFSNDSTIYNNLNSKQISYYRKELSKNPFLANWCGCFAPIPTLLQEQKISNFQTQGDSPCDPLCYNPENIGLYEITSSGPGTGQQTPRVDCVADICVIDNISIESFGETGQINFNQLCTGCKTQNKNCLCFLDVSTPNLVNKITSGPNAMANQINYVQNCPNSICFKVDDTTGSENIVECNRFDIPSSASLDGFLFSDGLSGKQYPQRISNSIWFVLILALFLFIIYQPKIFFNI